MMATTMDRSKSVWVTLDVDIEAKKSTEIKSSSQWKTVHRVRMELSIFYRGQNLRRLRHCPRRLDRNSPRLNPTQTIDYEWLSRLT